MMSSLYCVYALYSDPGLNKAIPNVYRRADPFFLPLDELSGAKNAVLKQVCSKEKKESNLQISVSFE